MFENRLIIKLSIHATVLFVLYLVYERIYLFYLGQNGRKYDSVS